MNDFSTLSFSLPFSFTFLPVYLPSFQNNFHKEHWLIFTPGYGGYLKPPNLSLAK
jgi:hypothetical protein